VVGYIRGSASTGAIKFTEMGSRCAIRDHLYIYINSDFARRPDQIDYIVEQTQNHMSSLGWNLQLLVEIRDIWIV